MKIGFAFCGSFCNHPELLKLYEDIAREHEIVPILSENAAKYSTRFGTAEDFVTRVEALAGRKAVRNIVEAEPLGPQGAMEVLVIAPCTGNTLAKLAHGITDGAVTMAAKGHLRNGKPVVLAIATNDGLSASAPNIAVLLNRKNYYFVPFGQDNARAKPSSLVADFSKIPETVEAALRGEQIQPLRRWREDKFSRFCCETKKGRNFLPFLRCNNKLARDFCQCSLNLLEKSSSLLYTLP